MTNNEIAQDLGYLKSVAEKGANAPLLGGRIGLMWNILLVPTLIFHGLVITSKISVEQQYIGLIWLVFGITGGVLSAILGKSIIAKPGAGSLGNRIERVAWPTTTVLIFAFAISITVAVIMRDTDPMLFNIILPFSFALCALNMIVLGRITQLEYLTIAGIISGIFMVLTIVFIQSLNVYFLAALGTALCGIVPSLMEMNNEPANVA